MPPQCFQIPSPYLRIWLQNSEQISNLCTVENMKQDYPRERLRYFRNVPTVIGCNISGHHAKISHSFLTINIFWCATDPFEWRISKWTNVLRYLHYFKPFLHFRLSITQSEYASLPNLKIFWPLLKTTDWKALYETYHAPLGRPFFSEWDRVEQVT